MGTICKEIKLWLGGPLEKTSDKNIVLVSNPGKGVCADPVNWGAILGKGGPGSQGGDRERQLDPDKGRRMT